MKYLGVLVLVIALLMVGYFLKQPTLLDNNNAQSQQPTQQQTNSQNPTASLHAHDHNHQTTGNASAQTSSLAPGKTGNPHFDQLTPEMQQAVKDSLLLEGPMKTHKRPDGTIVLPSNGRFTQMPVAVQMPDGSIQIREYSVVPKPAVPASK